MKSIKVTVMSKNKRKRSSVATDFYHGFDTYNMQHT